MNINQSTSCSNNHYPSNQFQICLLESPGFEDGPLVPDNMYTILWVKKGRAYILIDTNQYQLEDETIFYIKPGQLIKLIVHEQLNGFLISFERHLFDLFEKRPSLISHDLLHNSFLPTRIGLVPKDMSLFLENLADKMLQEFSGYYELRFEVISSLIKIFVIYLTRQNEVMEKDLEQCRKSEMASLFFSLLEKHFVDKKLVREYADTLLVTPGYLNRVIKEITGLTASYHIQQRIVLEAKRRVLSGGNNLKEIAYTLGFCDPAHFSKFFKSGAGTNFTSFKRTALRHSQVI